MLRALPPALLLVAAAPLAAATHALDLPAGPLGAAVVQLGRQTGTSIAVADAGLWARRVPALKGRMPVERALARLAARANAVVVPAGPGAWRLEPGRIAPSPARRAAAPADPQGDIVVTASKRDLPLSDYAGQVSRITGAELEIGGLAGTDAVIDRLATLSSTHLGSGRNKLFIRGIADSSFTGPTQSTVGQYLGDLRLGYNAPDPDLRLYDMAAVEVLEGPQGTLYGAGSLGGIVRVDPAPPAPGLVAASVAAGGSATAHGDPGGDGAAMLNLPLIGEQATLRAVGYGATEGGYIDNPVLGEKDVNRTDIWGGRATLRLASDSGWTVDVGGVFQRIVGADSQYADRDGPPLSRASAIAQGFGARYTLGQVVVAKAWDGLRLRSTTGIVGQRLHERYDATVSPGLVVPGTGTIREVANAGAVVSNGLPRLFSQRNATRMLAHETRLWRPMADGFGWVLGVSATANETRLTRSIAPALTVTPAVIVAGPVVNVAPGQQGIDIVLGPAAAVTGVTNRVTELTGYGEASLQPLPGLTLTAGARLTHARLTGSPRDVAAGFADRSRAASAARSELSLLPTASVIAAVRRDVRIFARYQQGFRPGGLAIEGELVRRFDNDRIRTLETGMRLGRPGSPAELTASVSHTRWTDIQADFIDGSGLPSTANIGDGRIWTVSATGGWRPVRGLRLDAGATWNDSAVSDPAPALALAFGRMSKVPNVASFAGRLGFELQAWTPGATPFRLAGWARYVGRSRLGVGPVLGDAQGDYVDSALHARLGGPWLGVSVGVTNLTDAIGNRFALGTPFAVGRPQVTPLRPRTVRVGLDAAF